MQVYRRSLGAAGTTLGCGVQEAWHLNYQIDPSTAPLGMTAPGWRIAEGSGGPNHATTVHRHEPVWGARSTRWIPANEHDSRSRGNPSAGGASPGASSSREPVIPENYRQPVVIILIYPVQHQRELH
jgi:hypothetical protein